MLTTQDAEREQWLDSLPLGELAEVESYEQLLEQGVEAVDSEIVERYQQLREAA